MQISTCVQCEIVHCCLLCFELSIAAATGVHFKNQSSGIRIPEMAEMRYSWYSSSE